MQRLLIRDGWPVRFRNAVDFFVHRPARHAACSFNGASVAPGYAVADSTTASAHKAAPWLCAFVWRRPC